MKSPKHDEMGQAMLLINELAPTNREDKWWLTDAPYRIIERYFAAERSAERESCAKIADDRAAICREAMSGPPETLPHVEVHTMNEALHIAQLIRARKS